LVSDIPAEDGKIIDLFYSVIAFFLPVPAVGITMLLILDLFLIPKIIENHRGSCRSYLYVLVMFL
jgi:hypothetical protein